MEVINSLNIDLENQIITSSNTFFNMCNDLMVCNFNNFKDISWQTNGTLLEDVKTCNNLNENNFTIINNISGDEKIKLLLNDCHEIESLKEKKDKCKSNLPSNNSLHNSYLKSAKKLKLCKKKRIDEKCDDQLDLNFKSEAEKFTIEPDIPGFNGMKNQKTENETAEINISKFRMKSVKKAVKPKSLGKKKGRSKKLETSKEKPSSYTCNYCQKVYPSEGKLIIIILLNVIYRNKYFLLAVTMKCLNYIIFFNVF